MNATTPTPEREFVDWVKAEARRRGLGVVVIAANPRTERFSYRMEIGSDKPVVIAALEILGRDLRDICALGNKGGS